MTTEQRAFFEYGKAYESAAMIRSHIRELLKQRGYEITTGLLHECRDGYASFGEAIRYAWEMRKACRRTVRSMERWQDCGECLNLKHDGIDGAGVGCLLQMDECKWLVVESRVIKSMYETEEGK